MGREYGGEEGGGGERLYTYRYTVTTRMTSALKWAAMRAILVFHNCEGQSHKTVSTDHNFREPCFAVCIYIARTSCHTERNRPRANSVLRIITINVPEFSAQLSSKEALPTSGGSVGDRGRRQTARHAARDGEPVLVNNSFTC